ncbi:hypothetical protein [Bowmanella dokdonensis]|uniref:Uncharacterized protein n=1 Tax=Bowmanella dokdonensis TaxID=751969 RepID=A0A939DLU7_9ALTE|nr:hypothetical protein [Bowmanella dokdonensis]MBN7824652.1 hypothetical protein [Bowmanella dokdonensis]
MRNFIYLAAFAFIFPFYSKSEPTGNLVQKFPKPLGISIWSNPSYIRYHHDSKPAELNRLFLVFGHKETDIVNRLGQPINRSKRKDEDRHKPGRKITYTQLFYPGLTIELSTNHDSRTHVRRLFITNCDIPSSFQVYLCSPVASFTEKIGEPSIDTDSELIYLITIGDMGSVPLRIMTADGIVTGIYTKNFID